jgi:hypothetical protein
VGCGGGRMRKQARPKGEDFPVGCGLCDLPLSYCVACMARSRLLLEPGDSCARQGR